MNLVEVMNDDISPEHLSLWQGCLEDTDDLARHLTVLYLLGVCVPELNGVDLVKVNAIEEVAYEVSGPPSCWKGKDHKLFLVPKHYVGVS